MLGLRSRGAVFFCYHTTGSTERPGRCSGLQVFSPSPRGSPAPSQASQRNGPRFPRRTHPTFVPRVCCCSSLSIGNEDIQKLLDLVLPYTMNTLTTEPDRGGTVLFLSLRTTIPYQLLRGESSTLTASPKGRGRQASASDRTKHRSSDSSSYHIHTH